MVLSGTEEQLALGSRSQRSNPSAHSAASVGVTVAPGLWQATTFQLIWGKRLQGKSCTMVNARESEVAPSDKALLSSFPLSGDALGFFNLHAASWREGSGRRISAAGSPIGPKTHAVIEQNAGRGERYVMVNEIAIA